MVAKLSEEAWALLGVLHRASRGGPEPPTAGFEAAYAELTRHGLARGKEITPKGRATYRDRFLKTDPNLFPSRRKR